MGERSTVRRHGKRQKGTRGVESWQVPPSEREGSVFRAGIREAEQVTFTGTLIVKNSPSL